MLVEALSIQYKENVLLNFNQQQYKYSNTQNELNFNLKKISQQIMRYRQGIDLSVSAIQKVLQSENHQISLPCVGYLLNFTHYSNFLKYFVNSARGINQLGNYAECISLPQTTYHLGFISVNNSQTPLYAGICFNKACSASDIQEMLTLGNSPINFWLMTIPQQITPTLSGLTILICMLLFTLFCTCLFATIYTHFKKEKPSSKIEEIISNCSLQKTMTIFSRPGEIKFLNGIRALSFFFVVMGHEVAVRNPAMSNLIKMNTQIQKFYLILTISYVFAVDVFYYLGGFMVGFLFLKTYYRKPNLLSFPLAVVQRVLRFWPVYLLTIFCLTKLLPLFGDGPLFKAYLIVRKAYFDCSQTWWRDLLFISNFRQNSCIGWAWYIQVDMQLFVLSIILLMVYVLFQKKRYYHLLQWSIIIGSSIVIFILCQQNNFHTDPTSLQDSNQDVYQNQVYIKPWSRTNVYFLGVALGIFYFEYNKNQKQAAYEKPYLVRIIQNRWIRAAGMAVGSALVLFIICIPQTLTRGVIWPQICHSLYLALGRFFFILGIVFMTFPYFFGYSNFFRVFLECQLLQHISKISFSCYMIHLMYIIRSAFNLQKSQYLSPWSVVLDGASDLPVILLLGLIVTLFYEMPIAFSIDMLFGKNKIKEVKQKTIEKPLIGLSSQTTNAQAI